MESREERKQRLTRERVAKHRERKAEAAEIAKERAVERQEKVSLFGEDRVADYEHADLMVTITLDILNFFKHKPAKVTAENATEAISIVEGWMANQYEFDSALPDSWEYGRRLGIFPQAKDAGVWLRTLYRRYLGEDVTEPTQLVLQMPTAEKPKVVTTAEPSKPVVTISKKPPQPISMDEYLDQQHGFPSSRVGT